MNIALWVAQIGLALAFGGAGAMKLARTRDQLHEQTPYVEDFSDRTIKAIGALEVSAALGLVLPAATGILVWLTPLAAVGLAILMVLAAVVHVRRGEVRNVVVNLVLLALALFVVWGRVGPQAL